MICIIVTMFASANIPPLAYQFPRPPDTLLLHGLMMHLFHLSNANAKRSWTRRIRMGV